MSWCCRADWVLAFRNINFCILHISRDINCLLVERSSPLCKYSKYQCKVSHWKVTLLSATFKGVRFWNFYCLVVSRLKYGLNFLVKAEVTLTRECLCVHKHPERMFSEVIIIGLGKIQPIIIKPNMQIIFWTVQYKADDNSSCRCKGHFSYFHSNFLGILVQGERS